MVLAIKIRRDDFLSLGLSLLVTKWWPQDQTGTRGKCDQEDYARSRRLPASINSISQDPPSLPSSVIMLLFLWKGAIAMPRNSHPQHELPRDIPICLLRHIYAALYSSLARNVREMEKARISVGHGYSERMWATY